MTKHFKTLCLMALSLSFIFSACGNDDDEDTTKSSAKTITSFSINSTVGIIDESEKTVTVKLPYNKDIDKAKLTVIVEVSDKASVNPKSGSEIDFSSAVNYTVTAEDGSKQVYKATLTIAESDEKDILQFSFDELDPKVSATFDDNVIVATVPAGTNVKALKPTIVISGKEVSPASGVEQDYSEPVKYVVTAADGKTKEYTVTVNVEKNSKADIIKFYIDNIDPKIEAELPPEGVDHNEIAIFPPMGTNVKALIPIITISENATISPKSGEVVDFSKPVEYTVTAENGKKRIYTVSVIMPVYGPSIDRVSETTLNLGESFTMWGYFGESNNKIIITNDANTEELVISEQNDKSITATIPKTMAVGEYWLVVTYEGISSRFKTKLNIVERKPIITSLNETQYMQGRGKIIITGENLKPKTGSPTIYFKMDNESAHYHKLSSADIDVKGDGTELSFANPSDLKIGKQSLYVEIDGVKTKEIVFYINPNTHPAPIIQKVKSATVGGSHVYTIAIAGAYFTDMSDTKVDVYKYSDEAGEYKFYMSPKLTEVVGYEILFETYNYFNIGDKIKMKVRANGKESNLSEEFIIR